MASYDPQRNRARARPAADEPAPVDLLLGAAPAPESATDIVVTAAVSAPPAREPVPHLRHEHGPACRHEHEHEHDHGIDPRPVVAVAVAAVAAVVVVLRRRRARRA